MNKHNFPDPSTGTPVDQLVCFLAREIDTISHLNFFIPRRVPTIQTRLRGAEEGLGIVDLALKLRSETGLPFWDASNLSCFGQGVRATPVLKEAIFHNGPGTNHLRAPAGSVTSDWLKTIGASAAAESILVWSSRVEVFAGQEMHIPMLDFHCPETDSNLELVDSALGALGIAGGYIVRSGKSFHYYGHQLISENDRVLFLSRALLLAPIVDRCWIAHQLIEGASGLRISAKTGEERLPEVVRVR